MFLRLMSSTSTETSRNGDNPSRNTSNSSLNCFVVNHQNLGNSHKPYRTPGLPKGNSRASTGNLIAVGHSESNQRAGAERSDLIPLARASSATCGLPQPEWLERCANSSTGILLAPETATVPLANVLKRPITPAQSHSRRESQSEPLPSPYRLGLSSQSAPNSRPATPSPALKSVPNPIDGPLSSTSDEDLGGILEERPSKEGTLGISEAKTEPNGKHKGSSETTPRNERDKLPDAENSGVPVFVMMPLDTVTAEGVFRHANTRWFNQALDALARSGVYGIAIDVWWGAVEREPEEYDWAGYRQLFEVAKSKQLKIQAVLSFHACGGNVGDSAQIPLPSWVLEAGENDPELFFKDKPRSSRDSLLNREYISFWADEVPRVLFGRSPLECYTDYMRNFRNAFADDIGEAIEEIIVGSGPCGELRYASYPETNGWRFPGVGEFQCYDKRALASLAECAQREGHPEWGTTGPHDAGEYNSTPDETGFFRGWEGSWDTPYGRFFLHWYSRSLVEHGDRLLKAASSVFNFRLSPSRQKFLAQLRQKDVEGTANGERGPPPLPPSPLTRPSKSLEDRTVNKPMLRKQSSASLPNDQMANKLDVSPNSSTSSFMMQSNANSFASMDEGVPADQRMQSPGDKKEDRPRLRRAGQRFDGKSISLAQLEKAENSPQMMSSRRSSENGERRGVNLSDSPKGKPVGVTLKVAGVHWWYRTNAHAAELTAGYFNAGERDGYREIIKLCAKYNATFTLTCVEMCDSQHPPETLCGPEGLLRQVKENAAEMGVEVGGENALPCFFPMHIDDAGLDRIVYNTQAWHSPLQREAAREEAFNRADASCFPPLPDAKSLGLHSNPRSAKSGKLLASYLPRMRGLTFLRLTQEMMTPAYQGAWLRFMQRMQNIRNSPQLC